MPARQRPLVWLHGAVKTPPFTREARMEAGIVLRRLQRGDALGLPQSRPMSALGPRCGELRIPDADVTWRIMYRLDPDAVIILAVFAKKTQRTPRSVLDTCAARLRLYDSATRRS